MCRYNKRHFLSFNFQHKSSEVFTNMKALIIIDQPIISNQFVDELKAFDFVEIVGQYSNPYEGLAHAQNTSTDVVFLNIEMSLLSGFKIAEYLKTHNPNIAIVFVTQYRQYAVQAFEINAIDYLTLPIKRNRLQNTINRIYKFVSSRKNKSENIVICCFESLMFKVKGDSRPLKIHWRTRKAEELFAYLLFNHGKHIRIDYLVDLLWSHICWDRGISQLYSSIYQIRRTIKKLDINIEIENFKQSYILHINDVELDIEKWERAINQLPPINEQTISEHMQTIRQYKGDIFCEPDYIWSKKEQKRLRATWLYHVKQVINYLFEKGKLIQIINIFHHIQEVHPFDTYSYKMLMKLYAYMNNYGAVVMQYDALQHMLQKQFDLKPDKDIQKWYEQWQNNKVVYLESIQGPLTNF